MKRKKIIISFDSSGELMVLYDIRTNKLAKSADPLNYNWFKGNSGFTTPIPFWSDENYIWRYR